ncbi:hypothetical protein [Massilia eburnea]|uniref:hypothetical protein n=1 Tax=Massilia eburnea TaxID=1776165 RepID=UPI003D6AB818
MPSARQQAERGFAIHGQHCGLRPGVARQRFLQVPRRVAEQRYRQDAVGLRQPLGGLLVVGRHPLRRRAQHDAVLGMAGEVAVGGLDGDGRCALGDDGKQHGGIGTRASERT